MHCLLTSFRFPFLKSFVCAISICGVIALLKPVFDYEEAGPSMRNVEVLRGGNSASCNRGEDLIRFSSHGKLSFLNALHQELFTACLFSKRNTTHITRRRASIRATMKLMYAPSSFLSQNAA